MTNTTISSDVTDKAAAGALGAPSVAGLRATSAVAFALGAALVFMVGFAHSTTLHNAAHDTRHSLAFPCH